MTPMNPLTEKIYQGKNAEKMIEICQNFNYESGKFATFNQWRKLGRTVCKGEKSKVKIICISENNGERKGRAKAVFALEQTTELESV